MTPSSAQNRLDYILGFNRAGRALERRRWALEAPPGAYAPLVSAAGWCLVDRSLDASTPPAQGAPVNGGKKTRSHTHAAAASSSDRSATKLIVLGKHSLHLLPEAHQRRS